LFHSIALPHLRSRAVDAQWDSSFFAGAEQIKDSTLDCMASPASKAFNESRLRHLMSLALPLIAAKWLDSHFQ